MLMPDINRAIDTCLDAEALRAHLQPVLAAQGKIDALRITKAHRSSSLQRDPNPLKFCFEVDIAGAAAQRFYGKIYRAGASAQAAPGADAWHVPALDLLLWRWPCDPGLPQLAHLLSPQTAEPFWGVPAADVQMPRYEPERRATLRYTHADGRAIYGKTFCDTRALTVHRRFAWMWQRAQQDAKAPLVARPLQCSIDGRTLWQRRRRARRSPVNRAANGCCRWPMPSPPCMPRRSSSPARRRATASIGWPKCAAAATRSAARCPS
jgi:hypothetical protein